MYLLILFSIGVRAQENFQINGKVNTEGDSLSFVNLYLENTTKGSVSNENGTYEISNISAGNYTIIASFTGFKTQKKNIKITNKNISVNFDLISNESLDEIVITGTLKPVSRLESPVPVEIYSPTFLKKNPTPNIFEALQNVNGVRPQLNCNVCNTGDIHINGLEGPYTLVLMMECQLSVVYLRFTAYLVSRIH